MDPLHAPSLPGRPVSSDAPGAVKKRGRPRLTPEQLLAREERREANRQAWREGRNRSMSELSEAARQRREERGQLRAASVGMLEQAEIAQLLELDDDALLLEALRRIERIGKEALKAQRPDFRVALSATQAFVQLAREAQARRAEKAGGNKPKLWLTEVEPAAPALPEPAALPSEEDPDEQQDDQDTDDSGGAGGILLDSGGVLALPIALPVQSDEQQAASAEVDALAVVGASYHETLNAEQSRDRVDTLSRQHLQCSTAEAYRRLDAGELEDYSISDELRGYRHLLPGIAAPSVPALTCPACGKGPLELNPEPFRGELYWRCMACGRPRVKRVEAT